MDLRTLALSKRANHGAVPSVSRSIGHISTRENRFFSEENESGQAPCRGVDGGLMSEISEPSPHMSDAKTFYLADRRLLTQLISETFMNARTPTSDLIVFGLDISPISDRSVPSRNEE